MRNVKVDYAVVGAFVLAMLSALVVAVALLTGRTGTTDTYTTHLSNVTGIKYGTKVTYEGFVVGQVEAIDPERDGGATRFVVKMSVRHGWPIPKNSVARIAASGFLSAVIVDIKGGDAPELLSPGAEIAGGGNGNLFAVMSDVAGQVSTLSQTALKPLLATLNDKAPELLANMVAVSGDLAQKTPKITADVQQMTSTLSSTVINQANAQRMSQSIENVQALTAGLVDTRKKLDDAVTGIDKLVAGNRTTVDASLKDLRYTLQTVARSIDSVTYNLEGTTRNMNEFSRQLRDNPAVLIGGRRTEEGPKDDNAGGRK